MHIQEDDFGLTVLDSDRVIGSVCEVSDGLWLGHRYTDDDAIIATKDEAIAFITLIPQNV